MQETEIKHTGIGMFFGLVLGIVIAMLFAWQSNSELTERHRSSERRMQMQIDNLQTDLDNCKNAIKEIAVRYPTDSYVQQQVICLYE